MSPSDNFGKKFKFPGKLRCSEQIEEFTIANVSPISSLKVSFVHEQRDIHTWFYVLLTGHIYIYNYPTYFEKKSKCEERTTKHGDST